jgi:penicillin-binding protein 1A
MADYRTLPNKGKPERTPAERLALHTQLVKWMWRLFYGGLFFLGASFFFFSFLTPSFKQLEDPSLNLASEVFANDSKTVLGRYYIENRSPISFNQLSPWVEKALVATEDLRYYEHSGVDAEALARVVKGVLLRQKGSGGGSTISMQLAKLLYSDRNIKGNFLERIGGMYYRKLSEMITAVKLERSYTKKEIIAMYLNKYDFSNAGHGIRSASEIYFGKSPDSLKIEEASTLVGMLNNSSYYNPIRRPEKCIKRRNEVFFKMAKIGTITDKQYEELKKKPLDMTRFRTKNHGDGTATYFRSELEKDVKNILAKGGITKSDGTKYDIYRDGLKIYTTIDAEMQRKAEEAMSDHMATLQKKFWNVWSGKDPWTYKSDKTTDEEINQRQASLKSKVRESERYQITRNKILDEVLEEIQADYEGLTILDSDILNMRRMSEQKDLMEQMIGNGSLSAKRAEIYRAIMSGDKWKTLNAKWVLLDNTIRTDFNRAVPMRVFAYGAKSEKDTTMTPLDSIRYHAMFLQIGSMAMDPTDGTVKAWVGGIGHKYFQYDHVRADRQVGSTFKPFVYSTAITQMGISPCYVVHDVAQTIEVGEGNFGLSKSWTPHNAGGYSGQYSTLFDALKESRNTASVYLMKQMGTTQPVRELVHNMGIDSAAKSGNGNYRIPKQPAICLGATDLKVLEMTGAYTTFADNGVYHKPIYINRITDKAGHILYQGMPDFKRALPENANYAMVQMLKYVAKGAPGLTTLKSELGGKTGTTNSYKDGWYIGITPKLVVGTWVGGEDNWIRFLSIADGQGGAMARPYFVKLMQRVESNPKIAYDVNAKFKIPAGMNIELDCSKYVGTSEGGAVASPNSGRASFEEGTGTDDGGFADEEKTPVAPAGGQKPAPAPTPKPSAGAVVPPRQTPPPVAGAKPLPKPKPVPKPDDGF